MTAAGHRVTWAAENTPRWETLPHYRTPQRVSWGLLAELRGKAQACLGEVAVILVSSTGVKPVTDPGVNRLSSAGVKLVGFVVLLMVIFVAGYAVGAYLGPVTTGSTPSQDGSGSSSGSMNMGGAP